MADLLLDFNDYKSIVKSVKIGKHLPNAIYIHKSAIKLLPSDLINFIHTISIQYELKNKKWNLLKIFKRDFKLSFLNYPDFDIHSYPQLFESYNVDLLKQKLRQANYKKSNNPPILHRKETFVTHDYPNISVFKNITIEGERIGLYDSPKTIGFKKNWERLIKSKGYYLNETGRLFPLTDIVTNITTPNTVIERHKTAISRNYLSLPLQAIARHNYLNGNYSILDYGCGKGDDVRELESHGLNVSGWDPVHRPDTVVTNNDIVNLAFVLNVIEDKSERTETLLKAWSFSTKLLVVAVMIAGENKIRQFTPYKDGVITSKNTFQKYYSQGEIRYYLESSLTESVIPVGQGIFLIFKDKIEEQLFLSERQHINRNWDQKTQRELTPKNKVVKKDIIESNIDIFTDYWSLTLDLGRIPANDEFEHSELIRRLVGSHNKAHSSLLNYFGEHLYTVAKLKRKEDLLVYFALGLFEKRKPQSKMPESLKRDIKVFFRTITVALDLAKALLFSVGNPYVIEKACTDAYNELHCGVMEQSHSFTFHKKYLGDVPAILRIYIGCATQLYGDLHDIHLIKAHIRSGKVSLMRYDDWAKASPLLIERIKIKLRDLDIDFFDYGDIFTPTPLLNKNSYTSKN